MRSASSLQPQWAQLALAAWAADVSHHGRYYDLTSSLYTSYHHLCELSTYC